MPVTTIAKWRLCAWDVQELPMADNPRNLSSHEIKGPVALTSSGKKEGRRGDQRQLQHNRAGGEEKGTTAPQQVGRKGKQRQLRHKRGGRGKKKQLHHNREGGEEKRPR